MDEVEERPSLDSLPFEIIEHILYCDVLSFKDICRISSVSQLLNCITKSNKLWRKKYTQMWPSLAKLLNPFQSDWKNECRVRIDCKKFVSRSIEELAVEYYHADNISDDSFLPFQDACSGHPSSLHILIDELESIVSHPDQHSNLTQRYYAKRALRYMRHILLETTWKEYLSENSSKLSLLKGACLISQWCQSNKINCTSQVCDHINEIVKLVFQHLEKVSPKHPVIARGLQLLESEEGTILTESLWSPYECKVVLSAVNEVLYNTLKFKCHKDNDSFFSAENSYIDQVLISRTGIPITLGIVYQTVAAQLGVCCLPVNFPGHFLLKFFLKHPHLTGDDAYTFIDVYEGGKFCSANDLDALTPGYSRTAESTAHVTPHKVFVRMCWNLVEVGRQRDGEGEGLPCLCNSLELLSILSPEDYEHKLLLARVYMHLCINMTRVISLLQEITEQDPISTGIVGYMYRSAITSLETQKLRRKGKLKIHTREGQSEVQFAVGMVMRHIKYNYRCVIYGWDNVCTASKDWIKQMGVYKLQYKDKQPFYLVLVDDGTNRYAAQENLEIDTMDEPVRHSEIGRFFESFQGRYYMPNNQKQMEYPDDSVVRDSVLQTAQEESARQASHC